MRRLLFFFFVISITVGTAAAQAPGEDLDDLYARFINPAKEFRPRVWWHWMNGNVTKEGIRKDLEWMDRAGIAGYHNFDAGMETPAIVDERLVYMTPAWKDAFNYALDLADSLGMEVTVASSPGWSITGGPWVAPDDAEKKVTWQESIIVQDGKQCNWKLPEPYLFPGPYQDIPSDQVDPRKYEYYKDLFVLAVRLPDGGTPAQVSYPEEKAGFKTSWDISDRYPTPEPDKASSIKDVIDVTDHFKDGVLEWDAPEGTWRILRFGYNLLGRVNGPASPEATGLEVDKLDGDAVRRYYDNYLKMYQEASGGRLGKAINCLMIDSYESGKCTWMKDMEHEFKSRRGYALRPWMPVLTGQVIESAAKSEQFLFDWRRTLGELLAENHYDIVNDILSEYGMTRYTEAHERRTAFVGDGMRVKRDADVPMSAIWVHYRDGWYSSYPVGEADIRESSSVAHIYGQNVCAAESFTVNGTIGKYDGFGAYQCGPFNLKRLADAAMAEGLNRFVIHTSVHQPSDKHVPGLALGPYGQYFNRHDTWAEEARTWTDYLSRSSFLLQQGLWKADIALFYGEDKNVTAVYYEQRPQIPKGYNYDFVNYDALLNRLRIGKGTLVSPSGMRYRALVIDKDVKYISFEVLRRIRKAVRAGVMVYGPKPLAKAGLEGSDRRFQRIADKLWGGGKYSVRHDVPLDEVLLDAGISQDASWVAFEKDGTDADIRFVHRHLDGGELYWVANISPAQRNLSVSFAVSGKEPEIWHADTGVREKPSYRIAGGRTEVDLDMVPDDAQFIFFTTPASETSYEAPGIIEQEICALDGPWMVSFQPGRGAPESFSMPSLRPLNEYSIEGVKYFSGTATYKTVFEMPSGVAGEGEIFLDLGEVHHMARVFLNGEDLGLAWKTPYRLPAGAGLRAGINEIEIRVTDSWANRLIGDARKRPEDRLTYTVKTFYTPEDEPLPSGLVGPVRLLSER